MLAAAGVAVAMIPGSPTISIAPATALALFIAPVLVDAAFDFPLGAARRFWAPLVALAIVAVLATTAVVAWVGWALLGLPLAAAIVLGAIVSPPDAAAATAVLSAIPIPRSTETVLKGESLFNDATALLLFSTALTLQGHHGMNTGVVLRLSLAVPGGLLFGIVCGGLVRRVNRFVSGTLGGNLLQFVIAYLVWIAAERLQLSAVLCMVAFAMTLASSAEVNLSARMRVQSYAVWNSVVFTLNVLAFLIMGMQARTIVSRMEPSHLRDAFTAAAAVVLAVVVTRMVVIIIYNRLISWWRTRGGQPEPASIRQAIFVGWCGMRGFVTLATAFALPSAFPQREVMVLIAFSVVIATLVLQGLTLAPLIRLLKLDQRRTQQQEIADARLRLVSAAIEALEKETGPEAENLRYSYSILREANDNRSKCASLERHRALGLAAIRSGRRELESLRTEDRVGIDMFLLLQEELDWGELTLLNENDRRIEES